MVFSNVNLDYGNFSFGPVSGRIYTIDHTTDTLITKTYPGGTLVSTTPLDSNIRNEVLSLCYDGWYFYTLSTLGVSGNLGLIINKWELKSSILEKQLGPENEVLLINNASFMYDAEAFCVQKIDTDIDSFANIGDTYVELADATYAQIGDPIYFGPSTASPGMREEKIIQGIAGNTIYLNSPLEYQYNINDLVIYRKNTWVFNNYSERNPNNGTLIQIENKTGNILSKYNSSEWKGVSAATIYEDNIVFVKGIQLLYYKPVGIGSGYQKSAILLNTEVNNIDFIKVDDIKINDTTVYKLQKKRHYFDTVLGEFQDEDGENDKYQIEEELTTAKVTSITIKRNKSVVFGKNDEELMKVRVTDQYNTPILGRSVTVVDDDIYGTIPAGYNSFVTDAQGEGQTKYVSGSTTVFSIPKLTIRDLGTSLRFYNYLTQLEGVNGQHLIEQKKILNTGIVDQTKPSFLTIIEQKPNIENSTELEQRLVYTTSTVDQHIEYQDLVLEQMPVTSGIVLLDQGTDISEITTLDQYIFLIYALPVPYSKKNPVDSSILVRIVGFGSTALDESTLVFKVNNVDVTSSILVTPFSNGLQLEYSPTSNYAYSSTVSVYIEIDDLHIPSRTITTSYTFDITGDYKSPFIAEVYPPDKSIDNLINTDIYAIIQDNETGVDTTSIEMYVSGKKINNFNIIQQGSSIKVLYQPEDRLPYGTEVTTAVYARDMEGNDINSSWSFFIRDSAGVLFTSKLPKECSVLVPVDTDVCFEVFGLEDGINLASLSLNIDNTDRVYILAPKVYRKE